MIGRALAIWLGIPRLANVNGAIREGWLIPRWGKPRGGH